MISTELVYELIDMREMTPETIRLAPAVMLSHAPGALHVWAANARGYVFDLSTDEADKNLEFNRELNQIVLHTEAGDMVLVSLSLDSYDRSVRPFLRGPMLRTTKEVQEYWSDAIRLAE